MDAPIFSKCFRFTAILPSFKMKYYLKILITLSYTYLESSVSFKIKFPPTLFWNDTEEKNDIECSAPKSTEGQ